MLEKFEYYFPYKDVNKTIHVYLPEAYNQGERYPVMYMYDGHNLFQDSEATYGESWGLSKFMDHYDKPLIIVGVECSHEGNERLQEYSPYQIETTHWGAIDGYGQEFMAWLTFDLKPYIDSRYNTLPFRESTAIGGSSMGGLMAFYSVVAYNEYYSKAACLSPSLSFCMDQLIDEWNQAKIASDTKVYFSFGEQELNRFAGLLDDVGYFNDQLVANGSASFIHIQEKGGHNEHTWKLQNQLYLDFLWK